MTRTATAAYGEGVLTRFDIDEGLCTGCGLCRETAPENLGATPEMTSCVVKQPENADEEANCLEAAEHCPIGALTTLA